MGAPLWSSGSAWTKYHYHPCSKLGVGVSEGCFIFDFVSLSLEVINLRPPMDWLLLYRQHLPQVLMYGVLSAFVLVMRKSLCSESYCYFPYMLPIFHLIHAYGLSAPRLYLNYQRPKDVKDTGCAWIR